MSAEEVTSCQATQTFHHHCGHIVTTFTCHSDLCVWNQDSRPSTPRPSISRPTTSSSAISNTSSKLHRSASSAMKGMGHNLGKLARRLTLRSSRPKESQITSQEFTFRARVSCPQVLFQPLYISRPCPACAEAMRMEPDDADKNLTGADEERWHREKESLDARMRDWAGKIGEWERGVRVPRKE